MSSFSRSPLITAGVALVVAMAHIGYSYAAPGTKMTVKSHQAASEPLVEGSTEIGQQLYEGIFFDLGPYSGNLDELHDGNEGLSSSRNSRVRYDTQRLNNRPSVHGGVEPHGREQGGKTSDGLCRHIPHRAFHPEPSRPHERDITPCCFEPVARDSANISPALGLFHPKPAESHSAPIQARAWGVDRGPHQPWTEL